MELLHFLFRNMSVPVWQQCPRLKFSVASEMHPLILWGRWDIEKCPAGLDATDWKR